MLLYLNIDFDLIRYNRNMKLYHVGFYLLADPDIFHGRKNADFGQGFYTSLEEEFSTKWAKKRTGQETILNYYDLKEDGLKIKRFNRDKEWFGYIFNNRRGNEDSLKDYDVIIGPIANDTIYDTWGILTSGFVSEEKALKILCSGPCYTQVALKTSKVKEQLSFLGSKVIPGEEIESYYNEVRQEEREYQKIVADILKEELKEIID